MRIVNLKTRLRSQPVTNQWGQMSGFWSEAFLSSLECVLTACVMNILFLWVGSFANFLRHEAAICCINAVCIRVFVCPSVSQQGRWIGTYMYLLAGRQHQLVAGQRLVSGLRLASGQRLVTGLRLVAGQRLVRFVESGFLGHLNDAQTFGRMCQIGVELKHLQHALDNECSLCF